MESYPNRLNELASQGKVCKVFGVKVVTAIELTHFLVNAGFDGIFVDLEHSALTLEAANKLCVQAMTCGLSPFVRVPGLCGRGFVQRVLDDGAQGVIFPHVDTVQQAKEAVRSCKYPPVGKRSITGALPHFHYKSMPLPDTIKYGNEHMSLVFVMIESQQAVDNVDAIAAVDGVDVIMVGTNDLSIELGVAGEWDNPIFDKAMAEIATAGKKFNRHLAIAGIYDRPDFISKCVHEWGARWIVLQHDLIMMSKFMGPAVKEFEAIERKAL